MRVDRRPRSLPSAALVCLGLTISALAPVGALAQQNPSSTASSAANAAGTTVNNQSNAQINTNTFYGFGPGINCPTPTFSVSGFGGSGSGSSAGDSIGAGVNSDNYGGIVSFTVPLGGANAEICKEIGKAQVQALLSQVNRSNVEAAKTQADINLVTALKCVELQRVAELRGPFADVCAGVYPRGVMLPPMSSVPGGGAGASVAAEPEPTTQPAAIVASVMPAPQPVVRQRDAAVSVDAFRSVAKPVAAIASAASLDGPAGLDGPQHQPIKRRQASIEPLRRDPGRTTRIRNETRQAKREQQNLRPATEALASRPPQSQPHPWLRPVQIAAVKVEVPVSRSGIAVNPQLNYIYVKIQQPSDEARLNQISPVMELNPVGDTLMARVGVFTKSRTGHRLMEARIQQLRQQQVDLIIADGTQLRELVV